MDVEYLPHPEKKDLLIVTVNGEEWRQIHKKIFGFRLKPVQMHQKDFEELFFQTERQKAKEYLIRCLSMRSYFTHELLKKLTDLKISPNTIQALLEEFRRLGYLNDQDYLNQLIKSYQTRKFGPRVIYSKLLMKGVPKAWIDEALGEMEENSEVLSDLIEKKKRLLNLEDYKDRNKLIQFLLRKGFSYEKIKELL